METNFKKIKSELPEKIGICFDDDYGMTHELNTQNFCIIIFATAEYKTTYYRDETYDQPAEDLGYYDNIELDDLEIFDRNGKTVEVDDDEFEQLKDIIAERIFSTNPTF